MRLRERRVVRVVRVWGSGVRVAQVGGGVFAAAGACGGVVIVSITATIAILLLRSIVGVARPKQLRDDGRGAEGAALRGGRDEGRARLLVLLWLVLRRRQADPPSRAGLRGLPAPGALELHVDALEVPARVVVDARQDVEDLVLLARLVQDGARDGERPDRDGRDAVVLGVCHDAAHLVRVVQLHRAHLAVVVVVRVRELERVDLCEEAHGRVVEEAADDGGALDEPGFLVSGSICLYNNRILFALPHLAATRKGKH